MFRPLSLLFLLPLLLLLLPLHLPPLLPFRPDLLVLPFPTFCFDLEQPSSTSGNTYAAYNMVRLSPLVLAMVTLVVTAGSPLPSSKGEGT